MPPLRRHEHFGDPTIADAILGRVMHHSTAVNARVAVDAGKRH